MVSLMLIAALALQNPPAPKPTQDTTARRPATTTRSTTPRDTTGASRSSQGTPVSRVAFQNSMRELWIDHIAYTRSFIVSASAGLGDTAVVLQRLLRNQDEIADAIKPYYGDAAATQLAALLRNHIQLAGQALVALKGSQTSMAGGAMRDTVGNFMNTPLRNDTTKMKSTDTTRALPSTAQRGDSARSMAQKPATPATPQNQQNPIRGNDTGAARLPATPPSKDTTKTSDPSMAGNVAQGQQSDTQAQGTAVAALRANADSIAAFLNKANPRNWSRSTLAGALQMHVNLLLQEATAHVKGDWQGSIAALDASFDQALQMADVLSEGVIKQFPNRFSNKSTNVSSLQ
jgi:hypothetical protein